MNHEPGDLPFSDQPFSFEEKEWRAQELVHTALGMPPTLVPRIGVKVFCCEMKLEEEPTR
ncbi:hypothetical protein [Risungbinella massiliensis]|uniref:hypothetical protein n=1 Tax=Risungbinella massiliensis TaxID=1329796 RepID=UPI00164CFC8E|nr:hypothetical protein [Risungbinella massiliensis]